MTSPDPGLATVAIIGLGNIGAALAGLVARMPRVGAMVLVDPDAYEERNIAGQEIRRQDVGRNKARVQARRIGSLRPDLRVTAIPLPVEAVPLGLLHADAILAGLDTREARRVVNEISLALAVPYIDAGVEPGGLLARVTVCVPGEDLPCYQCGWSEADYAALEASYPCQGQEAVKRPTAAPACLGALAASLQAIELARLLESGGDAGAGGRQIVIVPRHERYYPSRLRRNPACRAPHARWEIERLGVTPSALCLEELLALGRVRLGTAAPITLALDGRPFVRQLTCPRCAARRRLLRPEPRIAAALRSCRRCGRRLLAAGPDVIDELALATLPGRLRRAPLGRLGILPGDVVTLRSGDSALRFQLGVPTPSGCCRPAHRARPETEGKDQLQLGRGQP